MDYEVKIYTLETTDGIEYVAEIPDLKGCVGSGNSYEEALKELMENKEVYLEVLKELKKNIPLPKQKKYKYSGKLSLRMSARLHQKVAEVSDELGISINQYIVETLAESVGKNKTAFALSKEKTKSEEFVYKNKRQERIYNDVFYKKPKVSIDDFLYKKPIGGVN